MIYAKYKDLIESKRDIMLDAFNYIWKNPELGYKEWKTSKYLEDMFISLGYEVKRAGDIPGFIAELDTGRKGPTIAVMGELDALKCALHPEADPETQAVHACGHLVQTSALLGIAAALTDKSAIEKLCGRIRFMAIPAEETIDLEYRNALIDRGVISYLAGKIEFLKRGFFDGVDMAIMFHADNIPNARFRFVSGQNGCLTKHIEYIGKSAHAGAAPENGINALYAASLGLNACNSLRETFKEKDFIRFHPIMTEAGVAANAIPEKAVLETYVRASGYEVMLDTNKKINRALAGSAAAMGAKLVIEDNPGNLPFNSNDMLSDKLDEIITSLYGDNQIYYSGWDGQSSDVGDISTLIPVIQHYCAGATGRQHGDDYYIEDKQAAIIDPAIVMSCLIYEVLKDNGRFGAEVINSYKPLFRDKEEYFDAINKISSKRNLVDYKDDQVVISY